MDDVICLSSDEENEATPRNKNDNVGIRKTGDVADVEILNLDNDDEKDVVDLTLDNSPGCSTSKARRIFFSKKKEVFKLRSNNEPSAFVPVGCVEFSFEGVGI